MKYLPAFLLLLFAFCFSCSKEPATVRITSDFRSAFVGTYTGIYTQTLGQYSADSIIVLNREVEERTFLIEYEVEDSIYLSANYYDRYGFPAVAMDGDLIGINVDGRLFDGQTGSSYFKQGQIFLEEDSLFYTSFGGWGDQFFVDTIWAARQ